MRVKIKRVSHSAILPQYAYPGDIGADLFSNENLVIGPRSRDVIGTGIALEMAENFMGYARVAPRSGLGERGIDVGAGIVDSSYRGEVCVILINGTDLPYQVSYGDKIAQLIFEVAARADFIEVDTLNETERGSRGFGSSGTK